MMTRMEACRSLDRRIEGKIRRHIHGDGAGEVGGRHRGSFFFILRLDQEAELLRMNTAVRSATACDVTGGAKQSLCGTIQLSLHSTAVWLNLKTVKIRANVANQG
jgi:hypothetical protein